MSGNQCTAIALYAQLTAFSLSSLSQSTLLTTNIIDVIVVNGHQLYQDIISHSHSPLYWYAKLGGYVKSGESTLITTTCRVFVFTSLRNNKLSFWQNIYTQHFRNDLAFKLCRIAREWLDILEVIGCWTCNWQYFFVKFQVWWQKTSKSPHFISTKMVLTTGAWIAFIEVTRPIYPIY